MTSCNTLLENASKESIDGQPPVRSTTDDQRERGLLPSWGFAKRCLVGNPRIVRKSLYNNLKKRSPPIYLQVEFTVPLSLRKIRGTQWPRVQSEESFHREISAT